MMRYLVYSRKGTKPKAFRTKKNAKKYISNQKKKGKKVWALAKETKTRSGQKKIHFVSHGLRGLKK